MCGGSGGGSGASKRSSGGGNAPDMATGVEYSGPIENHPAWKEAIAGSSYTATKKGQYGKYEVPVTPNVWRKGDKERIYVPRNEYEQAGYITRSAKDVYGRNSGEHKGWYYNASRPGNTRELTHLIDNIKKAGIK